MIYPFHRHFLPPCCALKIFSLYDSLESFRRFLNINTIMTLAWRGRWTPKTLLLIVGWLKKIFLSFEKNTVFISKFQISWKSWRNSMIRTFLLPASPFTTPPPPRFSKFIKNDKNVKRLDKLNLYIICCTQQKVRNCTMYVNFCRIKATSKQTI